jgi:hypothetical protein
VARKVTIVMMWLNAFAAVLNSILWFFGIDWRAILILFNLAMYEGLHWQLTHYRHLQKKGI